MNSSTYSDTSRSRAVQVMFDYESDMDFDYDAHDAMSKEQLQERYDLEDDDASVLWLVLHESDPDRVLYGLKDHNSHLLSMTITESSHQGHDGWTIEDLFVIRAFLSDIGYAVHNEPDFK